MKNKKRSGRKIRGSKRGVQEEEGREKKKKRRGDKKEERKRKGGTGREDPKPTFETYL